MGTPTITALLRREFLCSAGGVTFLALVPIGRGLFTAPGAVLPTFTALPYVQPGASSRLTDGQEAVVVAWQTEDYKEQQMRALSPLFKAHGVDFCLHGHEHIYQRTMPLRFAPSDLTKAAPGPHISDRRIPGTFTRDTAFDGKTRTRPNGIIYVTMGAGGKELYDPTFDDMPALWLHPDDDNVACNSRFISRQHLLTLFDLHGSSLTLTQIGEGGKELDRIMVTKG